RALGGACYPFAPIARLKVYRILPSTGSGPVTVAVVISGCAGIYISRTCSTAMPGLGSGSTFPSNTNSRSSFSILIVIAGSSSFLVCIFVLFGRGITLGNHSGRSTGARRDAPGERQIQWLVPFGSRFRFLRRLTLVFC